MSTKPSEYNPRICMVCGKRGDEHTDEDDKACQDALFSGKLKFNIIEATPENVQKLKQEMGIEDGRN